MAVRKRKLTGWRKLQNKELIFAYSLNIIRAVYVAFMGSLRNAHKLFCGGKPSDETLTGTLRLTW